MISLTNVTKRYNNVSVVDGLNLTVREGELVILIGPSGCGKTTSLKMINKLITMDEGTICLNGQNIMEIDGDKLRRGIGYVIQQIGLFPNMNIEENILVVPRLLKWSNEKCRRRARELLELVGMPYEDYAHKYPNELSGGQQQRIGVLRALAGEPPIILMDEPFGALDPVTRESLQDELKILQKKLQKTIVFVTHDMGEAIKLADRIVFMSNGRCLQIATPDEMIKNPADPIISNFLGKYAAADLTCADVMERAACTVPEVKKANELLAELKKGGQEAAVVVAGTGEFTGVVTLGKLSDYIGTSTSAGDMADTAVSTVLTSDSAKDAFIHLINGNYGYLVVLNRDRTVAGVITNDGMTKKLAGLVWEEKDWLL